MKVFLINSGNDAGIGGNANENAYPPLSIISLATVLECSFPGNLDIVLFDGQVDSVDVIAGEIARQRPDVVGISAYLTSIRNCVRLLQEAKGVGARTILGNDHAIMHADVLMKKVPEIDFICLNDVGEESIVPLFHHLLGGTDLGAAPLLKFRCNGDVIETRAPSVYRAGSSLDSIPVPNRRKLPERYWAEYARRFHAQQRRFSRFMGTERVSTINRARGCAQRSNPCRYCGIIDLSIRYSSAELFWADVRAAREDIGATVLYEAFDSASSAKSVLRSWANERPADLGDTKFKMYAQAFETDEERLSLFKDLNVFCVNMGLDSGDEEVLKLLKGAKHSVAQNKRACLMYTENEIEIYTSFVLFGLGGEKATRASLDRTLAFAEWLVAEASVVSFDSALLYPDKSSPIGRLVWFPEEARSTVAKLGWEFLDLDVLEKVSARWRDEVFIDPLELCADFAQVCGVSVGVLEEYIWELRSLSDRAGLNFGRSQGGRV